MECMCCYFPDYFPVYFFVNAMSFQLIMHLRDVFCSDFHSNKS